ncbi:MAG TPA: amino acid adenylation domain-containing protein [Methylomirabilota bacterium]|nr:amino acid adenylation domain-containing protein [Methylomirabilota bacterium]
MTSFLPLHELLDRTARRTPDAVAVEEPDGPQTTGGALTYRELAHLSDRLRDRLRQLGVKRGDRVGLYMRKSIDGIATIFGALKAGAAYVPVDPQAPAARNAYILNDCSVRVVVLERRFEAKWREALEPLGPIPETVLVDSAGGGRGLAAALDQSEAPRRVTAPSAASGPDDLAYILYTSGSTGKPKGVMLSHENALSYVDWCSEVFAPTDRDRFSSHAPFHFDLSILDIYVPLKHGATLVLVGEETGKEPARLADLLAERRLTVWYSAPSILSLLAQYGDLEKRDLSSLRLVLFAGEVFPVKHLRAVKSLVPRPRYFNLYGPTETNVCTYFEVPPTVPPERTEPYPIGKTCEQLQSRVVDADGRDVAADDEGELCIAGPNVMQGYWNLPDQTARCFLVDDAGRRWYRTGDVVRKDPAGDFVFLGRRDRMVKRRGYRVELGEIEAGLYRHPAIREAAVVAIPSEEGVRIRAFLSCREGQKPSLIQLKRFCAENLPLYMVPDTFDVVDTLPKTSTDKVDYQRLKERA